VKPVFMTIKHDPPHSFGDCYRCCIASILEIDPVIIPHPGARGEAHWLEELPKLDRWFKERGLYHFCVKSALADLKDWQDALNGGYYIMGGQSARGFGHFVVAQNYGMVHDPHPDGSGITPDPGDTYSLGFICISTPQPSVQTTPETPK
jgi:hypothetical protein